MTSILFERVILGTSMTDQAGFAHVFEEAFGGEPYNEKYEPGQVVQEIWTPHLDHGCIVLARDEYKIVGFGCAVPLDKAPEEIQQFLDECTRDGLLPADFIPSKTWYMSEMGVLNDYRSRGTSYDLVRHRLISASHAGATHFVMRTSSDKPSNSRPLYEKLGAKKLAEQDVSDTAQVTENLSASKVRVYLYGRIDEAMRAIFDRKGPIAEPE